MSKSPADVSSESMSPPKPAPNAVISVCISLLFKSLSILAFSELITLPLRGKIA